jgi:crotonobetainyl-CoA:carnitine CoA-transferase CaiB-like acyl-CoA transferase
MIRDEFEKALRRFEQDFQKGTATKEQFDKLDVWQQLLNAKAEAEREIDAKQIHGWVHPSEDAQIAIQAATSMANIIDEPVAVQQDLSTKPLKDADQTVLEVVRPKCQSVKTHGLFSPASQSRAFF